MERCPNCGASTRTGAKFCTTCGFRLADAGPAADPGETAADSAPVDAPNATAGWPAPLDDAALAASETASTTDVSSNAADAPAPGPDSPADAEAPGGVDDQVLDSSWPVAVPSAWSSGWDTAPAPSTDAPDRDVAVHADPSPDWMTVAVDHDPDASTDQGAEPSTAGALPDPDAAPIGASRAEPISPVESARTTDAAARAMALVDELRALLPALSAPAPNVASIADDLEAALAADGDDAADRSALRSALLAARDRPRDIDTVLDLTGRVDAMLSLLAAHDRAVAAIERAVGALHAEGAMHRS